MLTKVIGKTPAVVCEVDLFNIAARGKVGLPLEHLHHAGAALTNATAVVEVVEALVGIDARIKCSLTQICALDAANLLAFLLESDGGHGFRKSQCAPTYKHPA